MDSTKALLFGLFLTLLLSANADCPAQILTGSQTVSGFVSPGYLHFVISVPAGKILSVDLTNPSADDDLDLYIRKDTCSAGSVWDYEKKAEPLQLHVSHCLATVAEIYYISIWNDNWFSKADYRMTINMADCSECPTGKMAISPDPNTLAARSLCLPNFLSPQTPFVSGSAPTRSYVHYEIHLKMGDYVVVELRNPGGKDDVGLYVRQNKPPASTYDLVDKSAPYVLGVYNCNERQGSKLFFSVWNGNYFSNANYEIEARFITNTDQCSNDIVMNRARVLATLSTLVYNEVATNYILPYANDCYEWTLMKEIKDPKDNNFKLVIHQNMAIGWVVLSFEGTDTVLDWKTDADIIKTDCNFNGYSCGRIHRGFHSAYRAMEPLIEAYLDTYPLSNIASELVITGHSLGGALATLCITDFLTSEQMKKKWKKMSILSIGSPRVGDQDFVNFYNNLVDTNTQSSSSHFKARGVDTRGLPSHRIVTAGNRGTDLVTQIPYDSMGYNSLHHPILVTPVTYIDDSQVDLHRTAAYLESIEYDLPEEHQKASCTTSTLGCSISAQVLYSMIPLDEPITPGVSYYLTELPADRGLHIQLEKENEQDNLSFCTMIGECPNDAACGDVVSGKTHSVVLDNCGSSASKLVYVGVNNRNMVTTAEIKLTATIKPCDDCLNVMCPVHQHCFNGACECDVGYEFSESVGTCVPSTFVLETQESAGTENSINSISVSMDSGLNTAVTWQVASHYAGLMQYFEVAVGTQTNPEAVLPFTQTGLSATYRKPNLNITLGRPHIVTVRGLSQEGETIEGSKSFTVWQRNLHIPESGANVYWATPNEEITIGGVIAADAGIDPSLMITASVYSDENLPATPIDYHHPEKPALFSFGLRLSGFDAFHLEQPVRFRITPQDLDSYQLLLVRTADGVWTKASETCPRAQRSTDIRMSESCVLGDFVVVKSTKDDVVELVSHSPWITAGIVVSAVALVAGFGFAVRRLRMKEQDNTHYSRLPR